eukprot:TRINITY_DN4085_c0_g2_i4.p1 TRINITY_DN4085_c0_g2~~TRINITY_DN4085_c0_g2_i4.p1  ORF type:complete len:131 (-),score=25.73 TRINITY_DN4085_c0_g2_i4:111-503(-)
MKLRILLLLLAYTLALQTIGKIIKETSVMAYIRLGEDSLVKIPSGETFKLNITGDAGFRWRLNIGEESRAACKEGKARVYYDEDRRLKVRQVFDCRADAQGEIELEYATLDAKVVVITQKLFIAVTSSLF